MIPHEKSPRKVQCSSPLQDAAGVKRELEACFEAALGRLGWPAPSSSLIERPREAGHGEYSSHVALRLAKSLRQSPLAIAQTIVSNLELGSHIERIAIEPPGFINLHVSQEALLQELSRMLDETRPYGHSPPGVTRVLIEFVSANPNGPLHIGHGRGAAFGDALARVLEATGTRVEREYYVNDAGRQMDILALSVWIRYREILSQATLPFPSAGYQGDYIRDLAARLAEAEGPRFLRDDDRVPEPPDIPGGDDPDRHIDARIALMKTTLGAGDYSAVLDFARGEMLEIIRQDLLQFGVRYDRFYSERSLYSGGQVDELIRLLEERHETYHQDGALWFRASAHGDEKDRVLMRSNGAYTYFAPDLAYHLDKVRRGYDRLINVLGSDHHGYAPRIRAGLEALGEDPGRLEVLLVQFAVLYRGGQRVQMSTRSGSFVTLRELVDEVGRDAARFFYVMRSEAQHLDFDLDLAKSQSQDNPVYYVQYAHARIASLFRECADRGVNPDLLDRQAWERLDQPLERTLLTTLIRYPEILEQAASGSAPHLVAQYLRETAQAFHAYYHAVPLLIEEQSLRNARLSLCAATRLVLADGLSLLGVSAPLKM